MKNLFLIAVIDTCFVALVPLGCLILAWTITVLLGDPFDLGDVGMSWQFRNINYAFSFIWLLAATGRWAYLLDKEAQS